jgi:hypothetical protein
MIPTVCKHQTTNVWQRTGTQPYVTLAAAGRNTAITAVTIAAVIVVIFAVIAMVLAVVVLALVVVLAHCHHCPHPLSLLLLPSPLLSSLPLLPPFLPLPLLVD